MDKKDDKIDAKKLLGFETKPVESEVTSKGSILYALGLGFSKEPLCEKDLKFTYELKDDFSVFPTYATCIHNTDIFETLVACPGLPKFNALMILHGEQKLELFKPILPGAKLSTVGKVANVADKGKGALVTIDLITYDVTDGKKDLLFINSLALFIRGLGGFGFKGNPAPSIPNLPKKEPCKVLEDKTMPHQAIVYRLSGDWNPLHIDPSMAESVGFEKPILHGLCSYGICAKLICREWLNNDQTKIKSIHARFTSHVFPGETLKVATWKEGNSIIFSGSTVERKLECVRGVLEVKGDFSPKL
jgi:acyl dehydratase